MAGRSDDAVVAHAFSDTELLRGSAFLFTNIWLDDLLQRTLNPTLPDMCNTDREEIVFTTLSYPLNEDTSVDALRAALDGIAALHRETEDLWKWMSPQTPASAMRAAEKRMLLTTLNTGETVLGTIELKNRMLVLEVNSRQRAERGRAMIEPVVAGLLGEPVTEMRTVAQMMASETPPEAKRPPSGLLPDEEKAVVHATLDQYYANLLDQPVPMLGNMTPRRAAKSAKGREQLITWLKLLENSTARHDGGSPMTGYDITWIWQELGVATERR
jgi:hypothetical protein